MLKLELPEQETFDRVSSKIIRYPAVTLELEHSLLSISKWESLWEIPFLGESEKTEEQLYSYVSLMSDEPIPMETLKRLDRDHYEEISKFLNSRRSATWFSDNDSRGRSSQTVTSELIYYWMTAYQIPFECEKWPLSRLMNLIRIAAIKNDPEQGKRKRNKTEMLSERAMLNKKRREEYGTTG